MKLTNKSEYALLALVMLAREPQNVLLSGDTISKTQKIPKRFLQQILLSLKQGGFVRSVKGQEGGYQLARKPHEISLAEIVRYIDGALAPTPSVSKNFYKPSPLERESGLLSLMGEIRDFVAAKLESTTLADVAGKKSRRLSR